MENKKNITLFEKHFNFLIDVFDFKLADIESYDYALYSKFTSSSVGIYFTYEFRDYIPQIQISLLNGQELRSRPGLYSLRELYKDENFKLYSFYLDEIMKFENLKVYKSYFQDIKTVEEAIKVSAGLLENCAIEFVKGDIASFDKIDKWLRSEIVENPQ